MYIKLCKTTNIRLNKILSKLANLHKYGYYITCILNKIHYIIAHILVNKLLKTK